MIFNNLDSLVKRTLLERGLPIHWYVEMLTHSSTCIRELNIDTLKIVNTASIPINDYGAGDTPSDFVDEVGIFLPVGGQLQEVPKDYTITPLRNRDSDGAFQPYLSIDKINPIFQLAGTGLWTSWFWNINDYGEPVGRFFGAPGGIPVGYNIFKERRQIQFTPGFDVQGAVIMYISDGQRVDNATQIDIQAVSTIQSFCDWKRSPNAAIKDSGEARTFYNDKRTLRGRLDDLTSIDIKNIIRNNTHAAIKG